MALLKNINNQVVIQHTQSKDTVYKNLMFVGKNKENKKFLKWQSTAISLRAQWANLEGELENNNWITLDEFFDKSNFVGKKLEVKGHDEYTQIISLFEYKDLQLIAELTDYDIHLDLISSNVYENTKTSDTISDVCYLALEKTTPKNEIKKLINDLENKEYISKIFKHLNEQVFHIHIEESANFQL